MRQKTMSPDTWVKTILQVYLAVAAIVQLFTGGQGRWMMVFYAVVALLVLSVLPFLAKLLKLRLNAFTLSVCFVFLTIAIYTGNRHGMYQRFWWYDVVLHFSSGILLALLWADIVFPSQESGATPTWRNQAPLHMVVITSIVFTMACACGWELIEFFWDILTKADCQRNLTVERELFGAAWQNPGIRDSMNDMLNGTVGSLVGYICIVCSRKSTRHDIPVEQTP